ncbi:DNA polymerase I [compost metagenome]
MGGIKWKDRKPYYLYKGYIVRRIGYMHDEVEFECEEPVAEEVAKMIEKAIEKAGQYLKLSVPLAGEGKVGKSWMEVH